MGLISLGHVYLEKQEYAKAGEMYGRAAQAEPGYFEGQDGLGKVAEVQGKTAEAITHYETAAQVAQQNASTAALEKAGIQLPALTPNPDIATAHTDLAMTLVMLDRPREALQHFRILAALQPRNADIHGAIANVLALLGNTDAAIAEFKNAIQLQPSQPDIHYNLATFLTQCGNYERASAEFAESAKLDPNNLDFRIAYANALVKLGKLDEALTQAHEAARIDPQNAAVNQILSSFAAKSK